MVRVKVCGMMSRDDVEACVEAGADAVGFIFAPGPRCLSLDAAERLTRVLPPFVTSVGVFAGNDARLIHEVLRCCRLDVLQFCGAEPPQFCGSFGKPTLIVARGGTAGKACEIELPSRRALEAARAVAVMVDARVGDALGGTGVRVESGIAARASRRSALPFILAGGLTPDNVAAAVAAVRPWAVDVRSGVERGDSKDRDLVERFVREAKGASSRHMQRSSDETQGAVELNRDEMKRSSDEPQGAVEPTRDDVERSSLLDRARLERTRPLGGIT